MKSSILTTLFIFLYAPLVLGNTQDKCSASMKTIAESAWAGNITNEITKLARKEQCNLIVVGNKGLGATARFFLGSVSNKLANNSPCSILIVK